ncbi:MAG: FHA domain-containing protein [Phototrophicaceae bacterium]
MPRDKKLDTIGHQEYRDDGNVETLKIDGINVAEFLDRDASQIPAHATFWCISLTVLAFDTQMVINISGDLMLGRQGQSDERYTFIDLSGYNAHKHGVSRQHAIIALHNKRVVIKDNDSSNRTLLNGKKLQPHRDYALKQGDIISLARLELKFNLNFDPFAS